MDKKSFNINVNDINFYCEMRGQGPAIVLVPDGNNDCEPYDNLSKLLSDEFTVLTFDMRGGTRSMDYNPGPVTPKVLADDVAAIIEALKLGPASICGCSSGGQAVLAVGKYHPEAARNIMVHEAALQSDAPIKGTGFDYFKNLGSFFKHCTGGVNPNDFWGIVNAEKALGMGEEVRKRIDKNGEFWFRWYLGNVDTDVYTEDDFKRMPPVAFSVGSWTPAWLVYANIETAKRGNCPVTWFNCAHHPEITCPEEYSEYLRKTVKSCL
jgi:pimeloyl-ACP methyl ester carboxylesterase